MRRLTRLARVREVERRRAAGQAAASGETHARLKSLAIRSCELAEGYAARGDSADGAALAVLFAFRREIADLSARATGDADAARLGADRAQLALAAAQRRRDLVAERLEARRRAAAQRLEQGGADLARSVNTRARRASPPDRNTT